MRALEFLKNILISIILTSFRHDEDKIENWELQAWIANQGHKLKIKSQKLKVKSQGSEVEGQRSKVKSRRLEVKS